MRVTQGNQDNRIALAKHLTELADECQHYRMKKQNMTPPQHTSLGEVEECERKLRKQALHLGKEVSEDILDNLENAIQEIQESKNKVKQALGKLKGVKEVIQGLTTVVDLVGSVIKFVP